VANGLSAAAKSSTPAFIISSSSFMGHQGTLGIRDRVHPELVPRTRVRVLSAFLRVRLYMKAYRPAVRSRDRVCHAACGCAVRRTSAERRYLRRYDEANQSSPADVVFGWVAVALYGTLAEVEPASRRVNESSGVAMAGPLPCATKSRR